MRVRAVDKPEEVGRVLGCPAHRPRRVESVGKGQDSVAAHPADCGLEAGQPVPGRRDPNRAPGIGADGPGREPRGHCDPGARTAPARGPVRAEVPGVPRRTHVPVGSPRAHRKLDGPGLAEHDDPGRDEPAGEGRGRGGHALLPDLRAAGGNPALDVDDVLERDGHSVEPPDRVARSPGEVRGSGGGARLVSVDGNEGAEPHIGPFDPGEQRLDEPLGREVPRGQCIRGGICAQELARRHRHSSSPWETGLRRRFRSESGRSGSAGFRPTGSRGPPIAQADKVPARPGGRRFRSARSRKSQPERSAQSGWDMLVGRTPPRAVPGRGGERRPAFPRRALEPDRLLPAAGPAPSHRQAVNPVRPGREQRQRPVRVPGCGWSAPPSPPPL